MNFVLCRGERRAAAGCPKNCVLDGCKSIAEDARSAPAIGSSEIAAICQSVGACQNLLNGLQAQNVSEAASALSWWNSTKNARMQWLSQQAAQGSTGSSILGQMSANLSPIDVSGEVAGWLDRSVVRFGRQLILRFQSRMHMGIGINTRQNFPNTRMQFSM